LVRRSGLLCFQTREPIALRVRLAAVRRDRRELSNVRDVLALVRRMLAFERRMLAYVRCVLGVRRGLGGARARFRRGLPLFSLRELRTQPIGTAEVEDSPSENWRNAVHNRRLGGRSNARQSEKRGDEGQRYDDDGP
jgi:hypothetical protein